MRDREIYYQARKVPLKRTKISENDILLYNTPKKNKKIKILEKNKKNLRKGRVCVILTQRGGGGMVVFYFAFLGCQMIVCITTYLKRRQNV